MNTRQKIVAGSILGIISLGTVVGGYAIASKTPWKSDNPLAHFYSSMILRSKTPTKVFDDIASQQAKQDEWNNLSLEEQKRRSDEGIARFKADEKSRMIAVQSESKLPYQGPRGYSNDGIDALFSSTEFYQLEGSWNGYINGVLHTAVSGVYPANPKQGVLILFTTRAKIMNYPTPTQDGPAKIVSEKDGIITLESQAGDWGVYNERTDARSTVTTKGGVIYKFDTKTQSYIK